MLLSSPQGLTVLASALTLGMQGNKEKFADHQSWRFDRLDLTVDDLPKGYDLILSRWLQAPYC